MKVSREQAERNRERIVEVAAQLFRERGLEGIGVADLMKSAGLTHGGFYGHFESKEDLVAQACERALSDAEARWQNIAEGGDKRPLRTIVSRYLSAQHRDDPGAGCLVAAVGSEAARQGSPVRRVLTHGLKASFELLSRLMPGRSERVRRKQALATYASLVGGLILSRVVDDADLSAEILDAVTASVPSNE
jgi:TetR/AcrR family transcriptional repressor of nem operon